MRKTVRGVIFGLGLVLILAACGGNGQASPPPGSAEHTHPPVPAEYAGRTSPFNGDADVVESGKALYQTNCAACHGPEGLGDGPAASSLNPAPMPLASEMASTPDDYLYWRTAEGGAMAPFRSAMPAWKSILSEEQIWQIITFLRSLS